MSTERELDLSVKAFSVALLLPWWVGVAGLQLWRVWTINKHAALQLRCV